jgi:Domain of unknown function (DUF4132)
VSEEIQRLQAEIAAEMKRLGASVNDPRLAPMLQQLGALMRQHMATMGMNGRLAVLPTGAQNGSEDGPTSRLLSALPPSLREAVRSYTRAARGPGVHMFSQAPALSDSDAGKQLLERGMADKATLAVQAYVAWTSEKYGGPDGAALRRIVSDLLRAKIDIDNDQAIALVKAAIHEGFAYSSYSPNLAIANVLKRHVETKGASPALRDVLSGLRNRMVHGAAEDSSEGRKLLSIVDALIGHESRAEGSEPHFEAKPDVWGKAVNGKLGALPSDARGRVMGLLELAAKGGANAKPAKGWLKSAEDALAGTKREDICEQLLDIIECYEPGGTLALENQNTLRALLWLAAMAAPDAASRRLEAYAQKCLTFSPQHFAYLSLVLGNAAILAFSLMPGTAGVGSLSRLRRHLKRPGEIKTVDKALATLASARGMNSGELEEIGLPAYGFASDGTLDVAVGPAAAKLRITEDGILETSWFDASGKPLSGPPAAVKDAHADALKSLKEQAKEIGETLKAQRLRLERLYLGDREWPLDVWKPRYLEEPLVSVFARRLIWSFEVDGRWVPGFAESNGIFDAAGKRLSVADKTRVKLWHPMQSDAAHVLAWRQRLVKLQITQPFKQAHREIYVLTDAERATNVYSNRFAGHVVEQKRFRALCQARGWACPAFGGWDPGNARPLKRIADRELQVEFWVDPIETAMNQENFQFEYLSTDQVRFVTVGGEPIAIADVDPVLFSELMRDADLFVGVAGIGADPTWGDRGDDRFGEYWGKAAFGDLSESGKTRHAVLKDLLPGLAIAPRCRLEERYLVVEGKVRTYRIHLGSGNIQMEPNNQYLCIVRDRTAGSKHVRLPFEGDDTLSIILSKAFMLADDDKIKDASIRSQIQGGSPRP